MIYLRLIYILVDAHRDNSNDVLNWHLVNILMIYSSTILAFHMACVYRLRISYQILLCSEVKSVNCWQIFINRTHLLFRVSVYGYVYMCNQNHNKRCTVTDNDSNKQLTNIWLNSLRAKFFRGNINMYLHFMSLLHIDMTQVAEILPHVRQGPTYST